MKYFETIHLNPQHDGAYFYLGEVYESIASNKPASEEPDQGDNMQGSKELSKMVGLFAQSLSRYSPARKAYEEAIRINPNYAQAHYNLGRIKAYEFSQLGFELEDAIDCYEAAVRLDPNLTEAQADLRSPSIHIHTRSAEKRLKPTFT